MASILTSWKEIAQYLGKGVRTVQRWESSLELPIRQPPHRPSGAVLAYPEELDEWLHSTYVNKDSESNSGVAKLRQRVHELQTELEKLRAQNELLRHRLHYTWQDGLQHEGDGNVVQFRMVDSAERRFHLRRADKATKGVCRNTTTT